MYLWNQMQFIQKPSQSRESRGINDLFVWRGQAGIPPRSCFPKWGLESPAGSRAILYHLWGKYSLWIPVVLSSHLYFLRKWVLMPLGRQQRLISAHNESPHHTEGRAVPTGVPWGWDNFLKMLKPVWPMVLRIPGQLCLCSPIDLQPADGTLHLFVSWEDVIFISLIGFQRVAFCLKGKRKEKSKWQH